MSRPTFAFERAFWKQGLSHVAGIDEAGRGAWAGPVVAGACIFSATLSTKPIAAVNDSKQLTPNQRAALYETICANALAWGVGMATNFEIDELGIVPATRVAMQRALAALPITPDALLIDALTLPDHPEPQRAIIRGDTRSYSIAAASILAKVTRDRLMIELDAQFPAYQFARHKGYGTRSHHAALIQFGVREIHRRTFAPIRALLD